MITTARQLKDLIRNMSKKKSADAQILMRNYMMERFLERISLSEYKNQFILKGGMLVAAMVGLDARADYIPNYINSTGRWCFISGQTDIGNHGRSRLSWCSCKHGNEI